MIHFATISTFRFLVCVLFIVYSTASAFAATHTVTTTADDGSAGTLRTILDSSASGDIITFAGDMAPTGGSATITLSNSLGCLYITHDLTIVGPTAYTLWIAGNTYGQPIFAIFDPLNGVTPPVNNASRNDLSNGSYYSVKATLKTIQMKNPYGTTGGAILAFFAELTCVHCTFSGNTVLEAGGAVLAQLCTLNFSGCIFTNNQSTYIGDTIYATLSDLAFDKCTFTNNGGSEAGGCFFALDSTLQLTDCIFSNNTALFSGAAIYADTSPVTLNSCTFSGNRVAYAGANNDNNSSLPVYTDGGAITCFSGSLTANNTIFSNNSCINTSTESGALAYGGAISIMGALSANYCTFTNNTCRSSQYAAYGGAISSENDTDDTMTMKNCSFVSNTVLSAEAYGGAMDCDSMNTATIENCSFISNSSQLKGGVLHTRDNYALSSTNTTFSKNSAPYGSVLYAAANTANNTLQLLFNTIVNNTGGCTLFLENSQTTAVTITNSLLANDNASGQDLAAPGGSTIVLSGGNFIGSLSGGYTDTYAATQYASVLGIISADLLLTPLRTLETTPAKLQVMIPLLDSPVLDAAIPSAVTTDARGVARPQLGQWDAGAIETLRSDVVTVPALHPWSRILLTLVLLGTALLVNRKRQTK